MLQKTLKKIAEDANVNFPFRCFVESLSAYQRMGRTFAARTSDLDLFVRFGPSGGHSGLSFSADGPGDCEFRIEPRSRQPCSTRDCNRNSARNSFLCGKSEYRRAICEGQLGGGRWTQRTQEKSQAEAKRPLIHEFCESSLTKRDQPCNSP